MKHLKMIIVLSIYYAVVLTSDNSLEPKNSQEKVTDSFYSDSESTASNDFSTEEVTYPIICKCLIVPGSTTTLEDYAKKGDLEGFANALAEGKEPSKQKWVHSIHFDPTQKNPGLIEQVNLQEFLTMSTNTVTAKLISFSIAQKMLKMLDIASTKEWCKLEKKERYLKLISESNEQKNNG